MDKLNHQARAYLEKVQSGGWGDADWSILDDRRGNLPEFPEGCLPAAIADYITRAARGSNVTFAHVAVPMLSIASGLIGTARRVQASRSFTQPCAFWCAVIGASGTGKTPGISVTTRALAEIEKNRRERIEELERTHETKVESSKAAHKLWQAKVTEASEQGLPAPIMPPEAAKVPPFVRPRIFVTNATIERIAALIQARPAGLPTIHDELAGLFSNMNRYSEGSDREFWLEAWNANIYVVERMGRPPIALERLLVSVTGGFQPDKLASAFKGDHDGMYARVCFAWPAEPGYRPLANDVSEYEPELVNAFSHLVDLGNPGVDGIFAIRSLPLSAEGAKAFETFRHFVHDRKGALEDREREWWAKGPAHVLRIAGTLAMLSWAWQEGPEPDEIDSETITASRAIWEGYFWPHSRAAIRQIGASARLALERRVLIHIQRQRLDRVSVQDIRRDVLGQAHNAADTEAVLARLVKAGWLRLQSTETGGRPLHRWQVNPALCAQSAQSAGRSTENGSGGLSALSALPALDPEGWTFNAEDHGRAKQR